MLGTKISVKSTVGGNGVTQHDLLTNLDYASSGHTGFLPTISGTYIQNQLNTKMTLSGGTFTGDVTLSSGDLGISATNAYYLGDSTTSGTWRVMRSGEDLKFQWYNGSTWNDGSTTITR